MTREQYLQSVKNIMITKNPYGKYHKQNFETYNSYGEMTPINSNIINNMPNSKIILSTDVYNFLLAIQEVTNIKGKEIPFFLYGKEIRHNIIEFNEIMTHNNNNRKTNEASFDQHMRKDLENKINNNLNANLVVGHGHSHPPIGDFHENFSLGDFASYMQMNQENKVFKTKQSELVGCLVTSTGDINFVFYDNQSNNFYRFTNVYVKDENDNLKPINCYGLNQEQQNYSPPRR